MPPANPCNASELHSPPPGGQNQDCGRPAVPVHSKTELWEAGMRLGEVKCLLQRWGADPYRRWLNEKGIASDQVAYRCIVHFLPPMLLLRTFLAQGNPALALLAGFEAVAAGGLLLLTDHRRETYLRWRDHLVLAFSVAAVCIIRAMVLFEGDAITNNAGSSPLLLLYLMSSHDLYTLLLSVYGRLPLSWSKVALPLLALVQLLLMPRMCHRFLGTGIEEPLTSLHALLSLFHSPPVSPALEPLGPHANNMEQQCLLTATWSTLFTGCLLPLFFLAQLELHNRVTFREREVRQVQGHMPSSGLPADCDLAKGEQEALQLYCRCGTACQLYLSSCLAWHAARVLLLLWDLPRSSATAA